MDEIISRVFIIYNFNLSLLLTLDGSRESLIVEDVSNTEVRENDAWCKLGALAMGLVENINFETHP